ncbi:nephrin-like [Pollicipes pollicipes]|uniref:nephrin-like n=1 Tax=Pollicipes pollicipes TaxID=41117 RepID=UPI001884D729|nr:nephrin-like [Pollicipes pollicipes]
MRIFTLLLLAMNAFLDASEIDDENRVSHVSAVEGQLAELPCDIAESNEEAELRLVLWYYGSGSTIYTYDARGERSEAGSHWDSGLLGRSRLEFEPHSRPATLRISALNKSDGGVYRCRVDYLHAPTRNWRVNLTVIVPPRRLVIFDELGRQTVDGRIGPYQEGPTVNVTCVAFDGSPPPNVTWWRDGSRLGGGWYTTADGSSRSVLSLGPLTRADLGSRVTCAATFHESSEPRLASTVVDMTLPPLSAELVGDNPPLPAGERATATCRVTGSRPEPKFTWWLGGLRLSEATQVTGRDPNVTTSTVTFVPQVKDAGLPLRCRAFSPELRRRVAEDVRQITVHYAPIVTLNYWPRDNNSAGSTVHMRCNISANPPVTNITWRHNGAAVRRRSAVGVFVRNDTEVGVFVRNDTLLLRPLEVRGGGIYSCSATNRQGSVTSNAISLQVHRTTTPLNHSDHMINADVLSYYLQSDLSHGALLCWATNALGEQLEPCRYDISQADVPETPSSCDVTNRSSESLHVQCVQGFDGGLRQTFRLEAFVASDRHHQVIAVSSISPSFVVRGLVPDRPYTVHVYALNTRGVSPAATVLAQTLPSDDEHDADTLSPSALLPAAGLLALLFGVAVAVVLVTAAVVATRRCRKTPPIKESQQELSHAMTNSNGTASADDRHGPDLIRPTNTGRGGRRSVPCTATVDRLDPEEKHMLERLRPDADGGDLRGVDSGESRAALRGSLHGPPSERDTCDIPGCIGGRGQVPGVLGGRDGYGMASSWADRGKMKGASGVSRARRFRKAAPSNIQIGELDTTTPRRFPPLTFWRWRGTPRRNIAGGSLRFKARVR